MNLHPRLHRQRQLLAVCLPESLLISLVLGFLVSMLVACATVDGMSTPYVGAPHPSPTDPAHVAILREPPTQAHDGRSAKSSLTHRPSPHRQSDRSKTSCVRNPQRWVPTRSSSWSTAFNPSGSTSMGRGALSRCSVEGSSAWRSSIELKRDEHHEQEVRKACCRG